MIENKSALGSLANTDLLDELANNPGMLLVAFRQPIAFNPVFVDLSGSLTAGLLLSVIVDEPGSEDWMRLDSQKIIQFTSMSPCELRGARQRLKDAGLIEERRAGFPAKTEFKVNFDAIKTMMVIMARTPRKGKRVTTQADVTDAATKDLFDDLLDEASTGLTLAVHPAPDQLQ
jgi:hypothetical protein